MIKIRNRAVFCLMIIACLFLFTGIACYAVPIIEDFEKMGNINETIHFTAADFLDNYQDDEELVSVRFPALPTEDVGVLKMNEADDITANQEITVEDLDNITFDPAEDYEGSFSLLWQAFNGIDYSDTANIDITIGGITEPTPTPDTSPTPTPDTSPTPTPEVTPPPTFPYIDMEGHWANDYAVELALKNILRGEQIGGNFYFEPSKVLNRGDFVLLLNAALGITTSVPQDPDFQFLDKDQMPNWLHRQGKIAYEAGVIKGVGTDGGVSFNPYGPLTRVEAITMLNNVLDPINPVEPFELEFIDLGTVPAWGVVPIGKLLAKGMIEGYPDYTIRPFEPVLRETAATLISGMLRNVPQAQTLQRILMNVMMDEDLK